MAFLNNVVIEFKEFPVLGLWSGITATRSAGTSDTGLGMFNPGGIGSFEKIYIVIEAQAFTGTPTFDVFWKGATDVDEEFNIEHQFWTGVATSTTQTVFTYFATRAGNVVVQGGVGAESKYMFDVPYLSFGLQNNGSGNEDIIYTLMAFGEKF